jgi:hypothetical protein
MPVGQMMGNQQGQGRVVGGRTAWPSLTGGQLFDLAGSGIGVRGGRGIDGIRDTHSDSAPTLSWRAPGYLRVRAPQKSHKSGRRRRSPQVSHIQNGIPQHTSAHLLT